MVAGVSSFEPRCCQQAVQYAQRLLPKRRLASSSAWKPPQGCIHGFKAFYRGCAGGLGHRGAMMCNELVGSWVRQKSSQAKMCLHASNTEASTQQAPLHPARPIQADRESLKHCSCSRHARWWVTIARGTLMQSVLACLHTHTHLFPLPVELVTVRPDWAVLLGARSCSQSNERSSEELDRHGWDACKATGEWSACGLGPCLKTF